MPSASEMTYIVSGGALNSTHSLTHAQCTKFDCPKLNSYFCRIQKAPEHFWREIQKVNAEHVDDVARFFCDSGGYEWHSSMTTAGYVTMTTLSGTNAYPLSVKLHHLRDGRTDRRRDASLRPSVRSFVRLSLCPSCLSGASVLWGRTNGDAS